MNEMMLLAIDLDKSYGPNSPGQEAGRIVDRRGKARLGGHLWSTGLGALIALQESVADHGEHLGPPQVEEMLPELVRDGINFLDEDFLPALLEMKRKGLLDLQPDGYLPKREETDFEEIWVKYGFADKVELFARVVGGMGHVLHQVPELVPSLRSLSAAAVLIWLDEAVIAESLGVSNLSDLVSGIESLRPHLDVPTNTFSMINAVKLKTRKEGARTGANARHAENRAMKREVFTWLDTNFSAFKSMDAAATEIASKVAPIAWRTAREWVGEWRKLRSASTA